MTTEEIDIIVRAKVEEAMKDFDKLVPRFKNTIKQIKGEFSNAKFDKLTADMDFTNAKKQVRSMANYVKQEVAPSIQVMGRRMDEFGNLAEKQKPKIEKMVEPLKEVSDGKYALATDIISNKQQNTQTAPTTNVEASPKSVGVWDTLKSKVSQAVSSIQQFKQSLNGTNSKQLDLVNYKISEIEEKLQQAKSGEIHLSTEDIVKAEADLEKLNAQKQKLEKGSSKGGFFGSLGSGIGKALSGIKGTFSSLGKSSQKVRNNIKGMGSGLKSGLGQILKYAGALFSLRTIYNVLSGSAQSWLSSQNAGAQQLSANIDYMKYAMGSVFAPIIQYVTNLVYQLMRAIQQVAYALTGVNIFAKASANSMKGVAGSAKKAKEEAKSLSNIHSEINNIGGDENSDSGSGGGSVAPNIDLSNMENTSSSIIDAIKNGNWYEVGATIGEKINDAMNSIPWNKIHNTAKSIGNGVAQSINGFLEKTNWKLVGKTIANGLNTGLYVAQSFVKTLNFGAIGKSIADTINGFFEDMDWKALADTFSAGIKGIFDAITEFFVNLDWEVIIQAIEDWFTNIDWNGIADSMWQALGSAIGSIWKLGEILGRKILEGVDEAKKYFQGKIEECGGNVVDGIFKGIGDAIASVGQWIHDHIFQPFIDGFKKVFGINSPSKVMEEQGNFIMEGLLNGIQAFVGKIKGKWEEIKNNCIEIFENIKTKISDIWENIKTGVSDKVQSIKDGISDKFTEAKDRIHDIFGSIGDWFREKFQTAYDNITNIFNNIGDFFSGIWNRIKDTFSNLGTSIGDAISGAVKTGINGVISMVERTINTAIRLINGAIRLINLIPGVSVNTISTLQLPRLAKGNVAYDQTLAIFGEYSGASNNPEITTPQNIMRETFEDVLSNHNGGNGQPLHVTFEFLDRTIFDDTIDYINDKSRRVGKNAIISVEGG